MLQSFGLAALSQLWSVEFTFEFTYFQFLLGQSLGTRLPASRMSLRLIWRFVVAYRLEQKITFAIEETLGSPFSTCASLIIMSLTLGFLQVLPSSDDDMYINNVFEKSSHEHTRDICQDENFRSGYLTTWQARCQALHIQPGSLVCGCGASTQEHINTQCRQFLYSTDLFPPPV